MCMFIVFFCFLLFFFFFFKQKTAYEIRLSLVGSEMCIRDRAWIVRSPRFWRSRSIRRSIVSSMGSMVARSWFIWLSVDPVYRPQRKECTYQKRSLFCSVGSLIRTLLHHQTGEGFGHR